MTRPILLVSRDPHLAMRLRQALPAAVAAELHSAPGYEACSDRRGWLLILWDEEAVPPVTLAPAAASGAALGQGSGFVPVLWLATPPSLARPGLLAGMAARTLPGPIVDFLRRDEAPSKLAFILSQHLTAAYLRRTRLSPQARFRPGPRAGASFADGAIHDTFHLATAADAREAAIARRRDINNALTGILGNAELAAEVAATAGRRLPPGLALRLTRILELAELMRDALAEPADETAWLEKAA